MISSITSLSTSTSSAFLLNRPLFLGLFRRLFSFPGCVVFSFFTLSHLSSSVAGLKKFRSDLLGDSDAAFLLPFLGLLAGLDFVFFGDEAGLAPVEIEAEVERRVGWRDEVN